LFVVVDPVVDSRPAETVSDRAGSGEKRRAAEAAARKIPIKEKTQRVILIIFFVITSS